MEIEVLSYNEGKAKEGKWDYVISVNDYNPLPVFRVFGNKGTALFNFNDIWLDDGVKYIWSGSGRKVLETNEPLPSKELFHQLDCFLHAYPEILQKGFMIHCWAGVSRSSIILLYLFVKYFNMTKEEALDQILKIRSFARPNLYLAQFIDSELPSYLKQRLDYTTIS